MDKISKTIADLIATQEVTIKALLTLNDKFERIEQQLNEFKNNNEKITIFKELTNQTSIILENIKLFEKLSKSLPTDDQLGEMLKQTDLKINTLSSELNQLHRSLVRLDSRLDNVEKPLKQLFEKLDDKVEIIKEESTPEI